MKRWYLQRPVLAWACYDWANSAFATTVMAGFFPAFFRQYWSVGADPTTATFRLGLANGIAGFIVAMLAPFLGVIADRSARRRWFLLAWTLVGVLATAALYGIGKGQWGSAAALFVLATMGFNGAIVFYDALLLQVAAPADYDRVSALGYALGYLGGGLLFAINVLMTAHPDWFGLSSTAMAVRYSFLTVAAWWLIFSIPIALGVAESRDLGGAGATPGLPAGAALRTAWRELSATVRNMAAHRELWLFLLAYWLYIDGVNTIIKMAVDYGMALGLPATKLLGALLLTQFVAFPAALAFGWLGGRIGARRGILLGLMVYIGVSGWAVVLSSVRGFFIMAVIVGLVQGGVQSLSRSFFGQFVPPGKSAEYFGFYNMLGKFATVLGPLLIAVTAALTGNPRSAIGSVALLFVAGALLLWRVRTPAAPI
ncbi:MAG: MFS transporter [Steroidobacteraceae bacterium]